MSTIIVFDQFLIAFANIYFNDPKYGEYDGCICIPWC